MMCDGRPINRPYFFSSLLVVVGVTSCTTNALFNLPAPTSDFSPGSGQPIPRAVQVGFVNNTPFRAIFTFGSYDQLDRDTIPTGFGQLRLEGTASVQTSQLCRGTFSVGGDELIRLLRRHEADPSITITDPRALVNGVNFSGAPLGDPLEAEPTEGSADGLVLLAGVDFTCERTNIHDQTGTGLLLFTFEQDAAAPGGFRIDYTFIAP